MKIQSIRAVAILMIGVAAATAPARADAKKVAGPNGGRLITAVEPRAEFYVRPDRKVQITFVDDRGQPILPSGQTVSVTAGPRMNPRTLAFAPSGNALLSTTPLPEGVRIPAVVQIKANPNAKTAIERFHVDLSTCGECKYAEYACICGH